MSEDRVPLQPEVEPPSEHPAPAFHTTIIVRSTSPAVRVIIAIIVLLGLVAYARFDTLQPVVLVNSSALAIVGVIGLLLGIPIVMAINAVCERVEELQPISEYLGYAPKK